MRLALIAVFLLGTLPLYADSPDSQREQTGADPYWRNLLHHEPTWWGGSRSLVDNRLFFLHPLGHADPALELEADLAAFSDPAAQAGFFGHHPQCVFVERYRFLKQTGLLQTADQPCPEFAEWKQAMQGDTLVLVFSSAYPNNPGSMFGHTFLRFKKRGGNSLLDYTASYAANTSERSGVGYAAKGLLGGYEGRFSISPYYLKVEEYSHSESRDLYEYELNLPPEAVDRVLNHLWELYSASSFDYYFLDENCSYLMARLLELANPEWDLTGQVRWYYLPADSVKRVLALPGSVAAVHYRPSLEKQTSWIYNQLSIEEQALFVQVIHHQVAVASLQDPGLLDALIAYENYRKRELKGDYQPSDQTAFRALLLQRARFPAAPLPPRIEPEAARQPELAHEPMRLGLGGLWRQQQAWGKLVYYSGLHDLLANDQGYAPHAQIDFLGLEAESPWAGQDWRISKLLVLDMLSLYPLTPFDPRFSWQIGVSWEGRQQACSACSQAEAHAGVGGSWAWGPQFLFYALAGGFGEAGWEPHSQSRLGPYGEWGLLANPDQAYRLLLRQTIKANVGSQGQDWQWQSLGAIAWSLQRNQELRFSSRLSQGRETFPNLPLTHEFMGLWYF